MFFFFKLYIRLLIIIKYSFHGYNRIFIFN